MISTETGPKNLTYADAKKLKKRREVSYPIVTDDAAVAAYQAAEQRLRVVKISGTPEDVAAAQKAADDAEQAVRAATITFRLRALPRKGEGSFTALRAEHTPTEEDDKEQQEYTGDPKAKAMWHAETFGPALVAACLVEPRVTLEEATEMATEWNDAEWNGLYLAAVSVNRQATNTAGLTFS